jgi:cytochrome c556
MQFAQRFAIPFGAAIIASAIATAVVPLRLATAARPVPSAAELKPLVDTHELMEHVVEGAFKELKKGVSGPPADAATWRRVRDASLLLGESGNLLLIRKPDDADSGEWSRLSIAMRQAGDKMSKAAKAKNYDATRAAYGELVQSCNSCHAKYGDDGEPKIDP